MKNSTKKIFTPAGTYSQEYIIKTGYGAGGGSADFPVPENDHKSIGMRVWPFLPPQTERIVSD